MYFVKVIWLISYLILPYVFSVKIGISKISTTTTVTPNLTTIFTETLIQSSTSSLDTEDEEAFTTSSKESTTVSTIEPKFPPKITTSSTKLTTANPKTTPKPTATTMLPSTEISDIENKTISSLPEAQEVVPFYCSCNLLPLSCDINCCCDPDCNNAALKVFNCFISSKYPELRLRLEDFQYEHGLPSCKVNDGWLCVFRTNTHPTVEKAINLNFDTSLNYQWPNSLMEVEETADSAENDFYKFGDPIKLISENTLDIIDFELPSAFKPPYCILKEPIRHLTAVEKTCLITSPEKLKTLELELRSLVNTKKILSKPKKQATDLENLENIALDLDIKTYIQKKRSKDYELLESDKFLNDTENTELQNYISEINIKIIHNFTNLLHCIIEIKFLEFAIAETQNVFEIWQKYNVEFLTFNSTKMNQEKINENESKLAYSGPLGYLQGEPIIIAKYITNNETEEMSTQNQILDYFNRSSVKNNTLNVFTRHNGFCHRNYDKAYSINYGTSSLHQCNLYWPNESLVKTTKSSNVTEICFKLQQEVSLQLFDRKNFQIMKDLYISSLGHPQNLPEKWIPLQVYNLEFNPVTAQFVTETQTLICRNMLLNAAFEFHIGVFTEQGVSHQNIIKRAVLKFGQRHDLEFAVNELLEVPLSLTVMFYDLTTNSGVLKDVGAKTCMLSHLAILYFISAYYIIE